MNEAPWLPITDQPPTSPDQIMLVKKVADGLYMLRRGHEGTAVAITAEQLDRIISNLHQETQTR